jgi:2-polyprenyl-3-methyl-5-hydroxy-6-metoxy-1,4-benzoquinol methylase
MTQAVLQQWDDKADEWSALSLDERSHWRRRLNWAAALATKNVSGGRSLDVGCGPGVLVQLLTEAGFEAHGADLSENMTQKGTQFLSDLVPDAAQRFHHCPDGQPPFDRSQTRFNLITAIGILEYITDRKGYIRKLAELLEPGGCLVLSNTNDIRSLFTFLEVARLLPQFWMKMKDHNSTLENLARTGIWSGGHIDHEHADWIYSADALDGIAV